MHGCSGTSLLRVPNIDDGISWHVYHFTNVAIPQNFATH